MLNTPKYIFALRLLLGAVLLAPMLACSSYPRRTERAITSFRQGDLQVAIDEYQDEGVTGSAFLSGTEAGTVLFSDGRFDQARSSFEAAQAAVQELEERALVSVSDLGESLASWALNDTTMAYEGEGFERVYLHVFLGLCYLAEGQLEDVLVEVRRANELLESEEALYDVSYGAGGLGHFLSAVTYELRGEFDEAYIDYQRMAEKKIGVEIAGAALVRLGKRLKREDVLDDLIARYGDIDPPPTDSASIVVIAGVGLGPYKEERSIAIETYDGLLKVAAPRFKRRGQQVGNMRLTLDGGAGSIRTATVEEVYRVAEENLDDRVFKIAAKSIARTIAKRELTKKLQDDSGFFGRIVGDIFSAVTERADLRFWQTLPDTWQAARMFMAPGEHRFLLEAGPAGSMDFGTFRLGPGETMFILARTVDHQLYAQVLGGDPLPNIQVTP